MGRQAKLKRQRKQAAQLNTQTEMSSTGDRKASETDVNAESVNETASTQANADPQAQPITRDFLNKMERRGYSFKADNRAPEITDERPKPQRR